MINDNLSVIEALLFVKQFALYRDIFIKWESYLL